MKDLKKKSVKFIIRSKENRKFEEIESFLMEKISKNGMTGSDERQQSKALHWKTSFEKRGNIHHREEKVETFDFHC